MLFNYLRDRLKELSNDGTLWCEGFRENLSGKYNILLYVLLDIIAVIY